MSVLILKNVANEGPGTIEDFLLSSKIDYQIAEMYSDPAPDIREAEVLVIMGGPMSVNEADRHPFIGREIEIAREFIFTGKKILGICLGAQIMAKALGAGVYPGQKKEIGWHDIELVEEGIRDRMMTKLAMHPAAGDFWRRFRVFQWHGETFDIPEGAARTAKSGIYPNQAFRYGANAYAFQFHIEVNSAMINEWSAELPLETVQLNKDTDAYYSVYHGRAMNFYSHFFKENYCVKSEQCRFRLSA